MPSWAPWNNPIAREHPQGGVAKGILNRGLLRRVLRETGRKVLEVTKLLSGIAKTQLQALWAPNSELRLVCQCPLKDLGWGMGRGTAQHCLRELGSVLPGVGRGSASLFLEHFLPIRMPWECSWSLSAWSRS